MKGKKMNKSFFCLSDKHRTRALGKAMSVSRLCAVYMIALTASSLRSTRDWEGRAIPPLKGMATTKKIKK